GLPPQAEEDTRFSVCPRLRGKWLRRVSGCRRWGEVPRKVLPAYVSHLALPVNVSLALDRLFCEAAIGRKLAADLMDCRLLNQFGVDGLKGDWNVHGRYYTHKNLSEYNRFWYIAALLNNP
ncbi:MAG: hypothetical protein SGJ03_06245, partial [Alphaproteobacteria bacterium]|nr:hypothetical protein [Alphaproteobacteria bacterium]